MVEGVLLLRATSNLKSTQFIYIAFKKNRNQHNKNLFICLSSQHKPGLGLLNFKNAPKQIITTLF